MTQTKSKGRRLVILFGILIALGLCGFGVYWQFSSDAEMPVISMAAERIPIPLPLPGFDEGPPNTLPTAILTAIVLVLVGLLYSRARRRAARTGEQSRFLVAVDAIFEAVYSFAENVAGEHTRHFFPLAATFFFFILVANWTGLLPGFGSFGIWELHDGEPELIPLFRGANADLSTTLALALISVIAVQYFGLRFQGLPYLRKFFNFSAPPDSGSLRPVIAIANGAAGLLEIISEVSKVFSFAFRLFGNIFAGEVLLIVVSFLAAFVATIPFMGLELFVGLIQALVFAMLSLVFYTMATHHH
ncbi:MAG: F0F1 ATP synthase subunit A [Anaerolineae bacterium]|nr:F0F1 ATP synthase subunit A [Anaerolineae bacterium]